MEKVKRTPASLKKLVEYFHMEILCRRPIANNRGMRGGGRLRRQPAQVAPAHARPADLRRQYQGRDHHPLGSLHPRG